MSLLPIFKPKQFAKADFDTINLDGNLLKVSGMMQESIVNIWGRKINQGDPGPDDHPINSTWIQTDWTGGGQVKWGRPDTVTGRFDFATSDTMQSKTISLPPLADEWTDPASSGNASTGLGKYNNKNWVAWGSTIRFYNSGTNTWDTIGSNLTAAPTTKGCVFTPGIGALAGLPLFCIPETTGFDYINGTTITNVAKSAVDLCVWDNRLWRLGSNGQVQYTYDLSTWAGTCYIPDGSTPRHLNVYLTTQSDPTVFVTTNAAVFVWDEIGQNLVESQLQYPKHPDQGRASVSWRGDFYTSVGDGVHNYNRSTIAAIGLDRDDGLPPAYRGVIIDMEPSYNAIFAMLSGALVYGTPSVDPYRFDAGDDYMTYDQTSASTILMKWNGFGWHYVDQIAGTAPTTVFVSDAENDYGVWYCANNVVRRIRLTRTYLNLKEDNTDSVTTSSFFESSWYNFGWDGQEKVLKSLELFVETPASTEYVDVFYKLDNDTNPFVQIGTVSANGETAFYFGLQSGETPGSTDPNSYVGIECDRVKLRFELHRTNTTNLAAKPVIRWFSLICRKVLRPVRSFSFVTNLTMNKGKSADEQRQALIQLMRTASAIDFTWQNETIKVELVALEFKAVVNATNITYVAKMNLIEAFETII